MAMVLSAVLQLDAAAFISPLGRSIEGMKFAIRVAGDLNAKLTEAFDLGGEISDLASQTGELPSTLLLLKQAFDDTGVGGGKLGQTLAIMRRNMAAVNDDGSTTLKTFERMGISVDKLKEMSAIDQLELIGEKIRGLKTPADQSAAAMEIFGRSGASMLTFFKDAGALDTARASLGGMPALLDDNANAFDGVSDAIARIKNKSQGFWAGIAEGALPAADAITNSLDAIDLTGLGQRIGAWMGTVVELFRNTPLGELLKDAIVAGIAELNNEMADLFIELGVSLMEAFTGPITWIGAALGKVVGEAMEAIGSIPGVGSALGLKGFEAGSFGEIREELEAAVRAARVLADKEIDLGVDGGAMERTMERIAAAAASFRTNLKIAQDEANAEAAAGAGPDAGAGRGDAVAAAQSSGFVSDALARIGGFVGGQQGALEDVAKRALDVGKQSLSVLEKIEAKPDMGGASWQRA